MAIRTVEEINGNVEIAETTGNTHYIIPEYIDKTNVVDRSELKDIFETIKLVVNPPMIQYTEEACRYIEMIKKCIVFLKISTIFHISITSYDL